MTIDPNISTALISSGGSVAVAITALILNYRGFASLERRIELQQTDLKEFNKVLKGIEIDVARIKDHIGLRP